MMQFCIRSSSHDICFRGFVDMLFLMAILLLPLQLSNQRIHDHPQYPHANRFLTLANKAIRASPWSKRLRSQALLTFAHAIPFEARVILSQPEARDFPAIWPIPTFLPLSTRSTSCPRRSFAPLRLQEYDTHPNLKTGDKKKKLCQHPQAKTHSHLDP